MLAGKGIGNQRKVQVVHGKAQGACRQCTRQACCIQLYRCVFSAVRVYSANPPVLRRRDDRDDHHHPN